MNMTPEQSERALKLLLSATASRGKELGNLKTGSGSVKVTLLPTGIAQFDVYENDTQESSTIRMNSHSVIKLAEIIKKTMLTMARAC